MVELVPKVAVKFRVCAPAVPQIPRLCEDAAVWKFARPAVAFNTVVLIAPFEFALAAGAIVIAAVAAGTLLPRDPGVSTEAVARAAGALAVALAAGFALAWAEGRAHDAEPASATTGQPWAYKRILGGDQTCKANQALHGEAANLMAKIRANATYNPSTADPLDPVTFVNKIKVPTFMACQWTDEQTGGHCPDLAEHFTGTRQKWFTFTNGVHTDSLDPETFNRWYDFMKLYVAKEPPAKDAAKIQAATRSEMASCATAT